LPKVIHPDDIQYLQDRLDSALKEDIPYNIKFRIVLPSGEIRYIHSLGDVTRNSSGSPVRFMGIQVDITEQKDAEEQIIKSLREKEVLLKEIHHRVKNNMAIISSLLSLQARYSNDENIDVILKDSKNRISSMALVHEKLYQTRDFTNINFREYVEEFVRHILSTYGKKEGDISLVLSIDEINLNIDAMIPFGLILNELVTNSLKYAFEGIERPEISISFDAHDGQAGLVYSDNGRGMPEHINFPDSETLGLQIVNMLTHQLKGDIELKRNGGTKFTIKLKHVT
jgi:two-component sensor histidine kinase